MHWSKKTSSSDRIPLTQFDTDFTLDYMMELSKINIFWEHAEGMCQDFSCTSSRMLSLTITFSLQVTLLDGSLWDQFNKLGTEMIITKAGR